MVKKIYAGIDMGGTTTKLALTDVYGRILVKTSVPSRGFEDKKRFERTVRFCLHELLTGRGQRVKDLRAIGIGLPGPIDFDRGVVLNLTNIRGWKNFHLVEFLRKAFHQHVYIDNDANCMALAESRIGAAKGFDTVLCVTLGTGVGGGLILDRKIYRGPFFLGGEIGHIPVSEKGPRCRCGAKGCLERFVGNQALLAKAASVFKRDMTLEELSSLAQEGSHEALMIWHDAALLIGRGLAGVCNILNPQGVVIGGGVSQAGRFFLDEIRRSLRDHLMSLIKDRIKVRKALLGNDAGTQGAALLAIENETSR